MHTRKLLCHGLSRKARKIIVPPLSFAELAPMPCTSSYHAVFDRGVKQQQRDYAAKQPDSSLYDYLREEVGWHVADRVFDIKRQFRTVLDLGCGKGYVFKHFDKDMVERVVACDMSAAMLAAAEAPEGVELIRTHEDEETVQLEENSVDLVTSSLSLHWVNDLAGCFSRVHRCLRPDCAFVGAMLGGDTLYQLRCSLQLASLERDGGVGVHVSPMVQPADVGGLLAGAGFTMLTLDVDSLSVGYPSLLELMWDLRGMAESGAAHGRRLRLSRDTLMAAAAICRHLYGTRAPDGADSVAATFQVVHFIGWKPGAGQPQPLERGSGAVPLTNLAHVVRGS